MDMKLESNFPWDGEVKAVLHTEGTAMGILAFRIPGWCSRAEARIFRNGQMFLCCKIENEGFNVQKNGTFDIGHLYSKNQVAIKVHYFMIQIAHMLRQLIEKGLKSIK